MARYHVYFRCYLCNRFMSWKYINEAVNWTPYGDSTMLEQPDEEYAHRKCWRHADESDRKLIREISWRKPFSLRVKQ